MIGGRQELKSGGSSLPGCPLVDSSFAFGASAVRWHDVVKAGVG